MRSGPDERAVIDPASVIGLASRSRRRPSSSPDEVARRGPGAPRDADRQAARARRPVDGGRLLPVRPRSHPGRRVRQPAEARPGRPARALRRLGGARSTASAAASSSSRRSSATTSNRRIATAPSSGSLDATGVAVGRRAADKLGSAGRRAFGRGDTPAAANLLRRATSTVPTDDPWRTELLPDLAEALTEQGDFAGARSVLDEAAGIAARLADERLRARVRLTQMHVGFYAGGLTGGIDRAVTRGRGHRRGARGGRRPVRAGARLAPPDGPARHRGRYQRAGEAAQRVIDLATQAGDMRLVGSGTVNYSICALHGPTTVEEALARCEALVEQSTRTARPKRSCSACSPSCTR